VATSDANFGIKGAPANFVFGAALNFEIPMLRLRDH
jgi:hypothetical protein